MRKYLITCLVLVLLSLGLPAKTYASTEGCPDSWSIDKTQIPNLELRNVTQKLGNKIVITNNLSRKVSEYSGTEGISPPLKNLEYLMISADPITGQLKVYETWRWILYLYGNSKIQATSKIETQGCQQPGNFDFTYKFPTGGSMSMYSYSPLQVKQIQSTKWAGDNSDAFKDFKYQENFSNLINSETERIKRNIFQDINSEAAINSKSILAGKVSFVNQELFGLMGNNRFNSRDNILHLQILTPECLEINTEQSGLEIIPQLFLKIGKQCKVSWAISTFNSSNYLDKASELILLDQPFYLDLTPTKKTIVCTKGKLTKSVTGTNPQCPKGYKQKT